MPGRLPSEFVRSPDDVAAWLKAEGIRRVLVGGFDLRGALRGKSLSTKRFLSTLSEGMPLCEVAVAPNELDATGRPQPCTLLPDLLARPEVGTLRTLPWWPGVALCLADLRTAAGAPHPACARTLLRDATERAGAAGLWTSFALEFLLLECSADGELVRRAALQRRPMPVPAALDVAEGRRWLAALRSCGLSVAGLDPPQSQRPLHGVLTDARPPLTSADELGLARWGLGQLAAAGGHRLACFASVVDERLHPCGATVRFGRSLAPGPDAAGDAPDVHQWAATLLADLPWLLLLCRSRANAHRRQLPPGTPSSDGGWAGLGTGRGPTGPWVELRLAGADLHPHLVAAGILLSCSSPREAPTGPALTDLATSLQDALDALESSPRAAALLGPARVEYLARACRSELGAQRHNVPAQESIAYAWSF